jgi:hypothetical protein
MGDLDATTRPSGAVSGLTKKQMGNNLISIPLAVPDSHKLRSSTHSRLRWMLRRADEISNDTKTSNTASLWAQQRIEASMRLKELGEKPLKK